MGRLYSIIFFSFLTIICNGQEPVFSKYKPNLEAFDFRGNPIENDSMGRFFMNFHVGFEELDFWSGKPTYSCHAIYLADSSWLSPLRNINEQIEFFQTEFDLVELLMVKLKKEQEFQYKILNRPRLAKIDRKVEEYGKEIQSQLYQLRRESDFGRNVEVTRIWSVRIKNELIKEDVFKF